MAWVGRLAAYWPLGLAYLLTAGAAVGLTRFDGGVAFLWVASAVLIAVLVKAPLRRWPAAILVCVLGNVLVTGLIGLGWAAALPMAAANMTEALVGAWLIRKAGSGKDHVSSLGWFSRFVVALGLAAPLAGALIAAASLVLLGITDQPARIVLQFFAGHALGNVAFQPLASLVASRRAGRRTVQALRGQAKAVAVCLLLTAALTAAVFTQRTLPLLFLPALPLILTTFRVGREGVALGLALLAFIGGGLTVAGFGPAALAPGGLPKHLMLFQFYLAATVLTVLSVTASLAQRRSLLNSVVASEQRFRMLAEFSTDILAQTDRQGRIVYISPAVSLIGGHSPTDMIGKRPTDLILPGFHDLVMREHRAMLDDPAKTRRFEWMGTVADGVPRWFESSARGLVDAEGRVIGALSVIRDVTGRKELEAHLTAAALTDSLTGLPNRRAFKQRVGELGEGDHCLALFDVDHFKRVNDRFGHDCGDDVLRAFGEVAREFVREGDFVARIGGEEFAVLLTDTRLSEALRLCDRLRQAIAAVAVHSGGNVIRVTVSGGVARVRPDLFEESLKQADLALYRAKAEGRDQLRLAA